MPRRRTRDQVLEQSLQRTETAEQRAGRSVAAAYNQARREIMARLIERWPGADNMQPADAARLLRQSGLLQQITDRMGQLERELNITMTEIVNDGTARAVDTIRAELALLPPELVPGDLATFGTINTRMIEQFVPVAMADMRLGASAIAGALQRELQTGLIQGENFYSLTRRLLGTEGGNGAVFPRGQTSAELATRRLVIAAENGAKVAAITEVAAVVPDIQKQAVAVAGINTTMCCLLVHGQIKPVNEPFELVGDPRFADRLMASPFHWNCRTAVAMYHPFFEQSTPTAKMQAAAQAEIARRAAGGKQGKAPETKAPETKTQTKAPETKTQSEAGKVAEAERQAAEKAAAEAEAQRKAAHKQAEIARLRQAEAERQRLAAEAQRKAAEQARIDAEKKAAEAEAKRLGAEKKAGDADAKRIAAEKKAANAEKKRLKAEKDQREFEEKEKQRRAAERAAWEARQKAAAPEREARKKASAKAVADLASSTNPGDKLFIDLDKKYPDKSAWYDPRIRGQIEKDVADHIKNNSTLSVKGAFHSMPHAENFKGLPFRNQTLYYAPGMEGNAAEFVFEQYAHHVNASGPTPVMMRSTQKLYLSNLDNKDDPYWRVQYNDPTHVSAATGGDSDIVVYGGRKLSMFVYTHEMGHNVAKDVYGTTSPQVGTKYRQAMATAEKPVSAYAANSPAEDFAESARMYATDRAAFRKGWPNRYAVIDQVLQNGNE